MYAKTLILLGLVLVIAPTPASDAAHPNTNCTSSEYIHGYSGVVNGYAAADAVVASADARTVAPPVVIDACPTLRGDSETELGIGGARFPAGTSGCVRNAHHAYGAGAQYWADESFGFSMVYFVGADGRALVREPLNPSACRTDGIITGNQFTDPYDCGAGDLGLYAPGYAWTPATLQPNGFSAKCDPYDGYVWGFVYEGSFFDDDMGMLITSTPTDGHFWG